MGDADFLDLFCGGDEDPGAPDAEHAADRAGTPAWHRPGPGRGHKIPRADRPAQSQRGRQGQVHAMLAARSKKRADKVEHQQARALVESVNAIVSQMSHIGKVSLKRNSDGTLAIGGKTGMRLRLPAKQGKQHRLRSQTKRKLRFGVGLLKKTKGSKKNIKKHILQ